MWGRLAARGGLVTLVRPHKPVPTNPIDDRRYIAILIRRNRIPMAQRRKQPAPAAYVGQGVSLRRVGNPPLDRSAGSRGASTFRSPP
jgi:hypothetical protein